MPEFEIGKILKDMITAPFKAVLKSVGALAPLKGAKDMFKEAGKAFKKKEAIKGMKGVFEGISTMTMGPVMAVLGFMQQLGVLQPLLDVLGGLFEMFGGVLLAKLMPAFEKLFEVLLSDDVMEIIMLLADILAIILIPIIEVFAIVLEALMPILKPILTLIKNALVPIMWIFKIALTAVATVLIWIAKVVLAGFIYIAYGFALAIASIIFVLTFGFINLFGAVHGLFGAALGNIASMQQGGIVTRPTLALIHGNEAVIPLSQGAEYGVTKGGGERSLTINFEGGVFATDEYDLAKRIARKIELYNLED